MMRRTYAGGLVATFALAGLAVGSAVFPSLRSIPNLENVPGTETSCQVCHVSSQGDALNPFGETVKANLTAGQPDWSKVWNADSDGDSFTNGEELGDPLGKWTVGTVNPGLPSTITHPGNPASKPAGPSSIKGIVTPTAWAVIKALFK